MQTITVRSIPIDDVTNWIDCSVCGPVATCLLADAHTEALAHLHTHGIETDSSY